MHADSNTDSCIVQAVHAHPKIILAMFWTPLLSYGVIFIVHVGGYIMQHVYVRGQI